MIKGNVYIGQRRWPLSLKGNQFKTTKKTMREVLSVVPDLFALEPGANHYPDKELALWNYAADFVKIYARFDIRERTDPDHILDRVY